MDLHKARDRKRRYQQSVRGRKKHYEANKRYRKKYAEVRMIDGARRRARERALDFDLKVCDIVVPCICPALGIPVFSTPGQQTPNTPSIDRVDNTKGYTKDNILIVSFRANELKSDSTISEMLKLTNFYAPILTKITVKNFRIRE